MTYFPSLPVDAHAAHIFVRYPHIYKLYAMSSLAIMRGPSPLSFEQRETLGAFVSALNECEFCYGAHRRTAELFGLEEQWLEALLADIDTAPLPGKDKPLYHYARKLTLTPALMTQKDAEAVFAEGWDEEALHSVIAIVCTFSFMNRLALGSGIDPERLDLDHLGEERHKTRWAPMVPIAADKVADNPELAYNSSPPDWRKVWGLSSHAKTLGALAANDTAT